MLINRWMDKEDGVHVHNGILTSRNKEWNNTIYSKTDGPQFSSVAQSCRILCDPMNCSMPGVPVHHQFLELAQTHVPSSQWCHWTISSSVISFISCLQSFPASGSFPMSQFFASGGRSIGVSASASVLPMNIYSWISLGLISSISLLSKGLSRVFSRSTTKSINSLVLSLLYGQTLTSIHDSWKNQSFDYTDLCQESDVSAFY